MRENYKFAVKSAIVDFQFNDDDAATHLSAANVQSIRVSQPVPEQGCVNLKALPVGCLATCTDGQVSSSELPMDEYHMLIGDIQRASFMASSGLLTAMQHYYRELDMSALKLVDTEMVGLQLPARVGEFMRIQRLHTEEVLEQLTNDWTIKVRCMIFCRLGISIWARVPHNGA